MTAAHPPAVAASSLPNLVIAGVTKSGTSSLHRYLGQHPDVVPGDVKEIDYYAPMLRGEQPPPLAEYAAHFRGDPAPWRLDASPRYFTGGPALMRRLAADLDGPRIVLALREPVARMWSSYTYKRSKNRLPDGMRFPEFVDACLDVAERGLAASSDRDAFRTAATGRYAEFVRGWLDTFGDHVLVVFFDDIAAAPAQTTSAVCAWAGIDSAPVAAFDFGVRNATVQPRSQLVRRVALRVNRRVGTVAGDDSRLKRALRSAYGRVNHGGPLDETMDEADRDRLHHFFAPSLPPLRRMLADERGYAVPDWLSA